MIASSAMGDGVLTRDTEKRPCTPGVLTGVVPTVALGDGVRVFGDFFPGDGVLGDAVLTFVDFGDADLLFAGLFTFGSSGSHSYKNKII